MEFLGRDLSDPVSSGENYGYGIDGSSPAAVESPGSSGFTLEELNSLMMDENGGGESAMAGSSMIKELQQLILYDSPSPSSSSSQQQQAVTVTTSASDWSSLDGLSIKSWTSEMIVGEDQEVSSSSCNTMERSSNQELSSSDSSGSANLRDLTPTHVADRQELRGFSSDRADLVGILQEVIASHLATDNHKRNSQEKPAATAINRKKRNSAATSEEEDAVEGLKTVIKIRRQGSETADKSNGHNPRLYSVSPDIMTLLHDCAHAVAVRDVTNANSLAVSIRRQHGASSTAADPARRVAYYFVESLLARVLGTGTALAAATASNSGGPDVMERVYEFRLHATPSPLVPHFVSTSTIVAAAQGKRFLHIVEIGMARNRFQWSLLLQALAHRRDVPLRRLRVTAVDSPQHKALLAQLAQRIIFESSRLGLEAEVELEIADAHAWEAVLPRIVPRAAPGEVLVVNALFALDFLEDETAVQARSPRRAVLSALRRMDPAVLVLGINHGYRAVPQFSFLERFVQAVTRFNAKFDAALECGSGGAQAAGRAAYEGQFLGPEILNLVACDGSDRLVRTAPCEEWERAMVGAGFVALPLEESTVLRAQAMMGNYNRNFELDYSDGWIKLAWKKVTTQCVSVWQPRRIILPRY
ncbi:GRAS family protein [Selaginella moellendorffii]|uniref:GRAS family protein n=1 Tax=Selaginella moellendorffii TaxID=88036 RepID=D8SR69_SELML|nr:scarecrow-like protein 14 [Selaginella moellendorffii]EFJ13098.1 GRAS family protein [Selaginella moellendorffii]|eukprot:XP_002985921.1 scarecrow-like protein 14 [Selaginella moellendorffii]